MSSTACWPWDARTTSASSDPKRRLGCVRAYLKSLHHADRRGRQAVFGELRYGCALQFGGP
jgi:hypothetical protein